MLLNSSGNIKHTAALAFFPLLYIVLGFLFIKEIHSFYIYGPDQEYAYLMNGANLASGYLKVGHVDHPGTPVQCFAAVIIFIQHLIQGKHLVYQDVLLNPESYLYTISTILILLLATVTFFTGTYLLKHTGNIGIAILFQLTPLGRNIVEQIIMLRPEALIVITGTFFMAYLYITVIKPERELEEKTGYKRAILSGVFIAFFIACKFTCIPLILLILFLFNTVKERLVFLIILGISFFVFIIPALSHLPDMLQWVHDLLMHDGTYGDGNERILDPVAFKASLLEIFFKTEFMLPMVYAILSLAFVISVIGFIKKNETNKIYVKAIAGLWLTITCIILVVAKHYRFYYLLPAQLCFPLVLVVSHSILSENLTFYSRIKKPIIPAFCIIFSALLIPQAFTNSLQAGLHKSTMNKTREFISKRGNIPVIITTGEDQASAFIEPSIYFGSVYSGSYMKHLYLNFIEIYYPGSYEYSINNNRLFHWDENAHPAQIFSQSSKVWIYFRGKYVQNSKREQEVLNKLCNLPSLAPLGHYEKIYSDTSSFEDIFEVHTDSVLAAKLLKNNRKVLCNMETMTEDKSAFTSADQQQHYFLKDGLVSKDASHSGSNSVMLDADDHYGLETYVKVKPGYFIIASVWRKSAEGEGDIVFSALDETTLLISGAAIVDSGKGWQKIECSYTVPANYADDSLHFYLYYPGNKAAYFDDLEITIHPMKISADSVAGKNKGLH